MTAVKNNAHAIRFLALFFFAFGFVVLDVFELSLFYSTVTSDYLFSHLSPPYSLRDQAF